MGINGMNPYEFWSSYKLNEIPKVDINKQQTEPEVKKVEEPKASPIVIEPVEDKRPKAVNLNEVSLTANKQETFSYIGKDKDVDMLDMQKAISDMKKDSILQDYQYFVGDFNNVYNSEDGKVIAKF